MDDVSGILTTLAANALGISPFLALGSVYEARMPNDENMGLDREAERNSRRFFFFFFFFFFEVVPSAVLAS